MKVQKLGLVLGINMAAACLMMQGCKATKPGNNVPPPRQDRVITVVSMPTVKPGVKTAKPFAKTEVEPEDVPVQTIEVAPAPVVTPLPPPPVVQPTTTVQPQPSAVATVKPLPTATAKPAKSDVPKNAAAAPVEAVATEEYVVRSGDTLFIISKRTNIRQRAILATNPGLKAERLRVGQKIKLPVLAPAATVVAAAPAQKDAKPAATVVAAAPAQKGEALAEVLKETAPATNNVAANTKAPVKTKSAFVEYNGPTKEYIAKSGDSLGKIAFESGITIRALKAMNGLKEDHLRIGQKLKIPAEKQVAAAKPAVKADGAKEGTAAATVPAETKKPEDAAKKEDAKDATKPAEAAKQPAEAAKPAETVKPAEAAKPVETVKPADAVKAVEEKPADAVKAGNATNPAADNAAAGDAAPKDEVKQPETEPAPPAEAAGPTHVVKEGEDLVTIAIMYAISPSVLMDLNNISMADQDKLKPGTVLKLPANIKK